MKNGKLWGMAAILALLFVCAACRGNGTTDPTTINIAAIAGLSAPVTGAAPVAAIMPTDQYTGTVTWSPAVSGTFAALTPYTATITLAAKAGYTLQGVAPNFFTVAGTATAATNAANSGLITAIFPATETPVENPTLTGTVTIPTFIRVNDSVTTVTTGSNATTLRYQWQISSTVNGIFSPISGETGQTYTPVAADQDKYIRVSVSATGYNGAIISNVVIVRNASTNPQDILYEVNVSYGAGGSVSASPESGNVGTDITLHIFPDSGYRLNTLTVKDTANIDVPVSGGGNIRTFKIPQSDVTVNATFEALPANTIAVRFTGFAEESINLSDNTLNDLSQYQSQSLTVTVYGDYDHYQWYVDGSERSSGSDEYTVYSGNFNVGIHTLTVVVWKDGAAGAEAYSKEVTFKVVY